jgi:predicted O-linked N-acetylglucosamine transferase (SPINDLY family)
MDGHYNLEEGFTGDTDEDAENKDEVDENENNKEKVNDLESGDDNTKVNEAEVIRKNNEKKKKNAATLQESMIADPEELDTDANLKKSEEKTKNKIKGLSNINDTGLEQIQEQTKILLDTHNELIQNIETLKPYLKQANDFTKSLSKIMGGSSASSSLE